MATETGGGGADPATLPYRPCVGVVLANSAGQVFIAERLDTPGAWQMPQGGIDEGETPLDAAHRELLEETGIGSEDAVLVVEHPDWLTYDLPANLVGKVWKGRWRGQRQRWFLFRFIGDDSAITVDVAHPEFSAWRWASPDDAVAAIVSFKQPIYRAVFSHFGPFLGTN